MADPSAPHRPAEHRGDGAPREGAGRGSPSASEPLTLTGAGGHVECPRCHARFWVESVTLKLANDSRTQKIEIHFRHPEAPLEALVEEVKRTLVLRALREAGGVKVRAAQIARMKYTTFYDLMRRLGITDQEVRGETGGVAGTR